MPLDVELPPTTTGLPPPAHQNRIHPPLGSDLRLARKVLGLTQAELAATAGCSILAVRQAEATLGALTVFQALAAACAMLIDAKSLPPGENKGVHLWDRDYMEGYGGRAARACG